MLTTQKTLCVIRHDNNKLPILDYIDKAQFTALALSGGVILWLYRGMSMLIPAARIANMAANIEIANELNLSSKTRPPKFLFTTADAIVLPKLIADALLGDDKQPH